MDNNSQSSQINADDPLQRLVQLLILVAKKLLVSYQYIIVILTVVFLAILAFLTLISSFFLNQKGQ